MSAVAMIASPFEHPRVAPAPAPVAAADTPVENAPLAAEETPLETAAIAPIAAAGPAAEAAPTPQQSSDVTGVLALVLIGLVALALGAFALLAFRRRPNKAYRAAPVIEKPIVERRPLANEAPAPVATTPVSAANTPITTAALIGTNHRSSDHGLANEGAAVSLPRELPATFAERDALMKRMVAAKPDRANPFRSYKARVRRARLILQSLDRKFERAQPWIDLSQYSRNWPALARRPAYQAA